MCRQRPEDLRVVADVDVLVDRDHRLHVGIPAEEREHDLARFALAACAQRHIGVEVHARVRVMQARHARKALHQLLGHLGLARHAREVQVLGRVAAHDVYKDGVLAAQQRVDAEKRVRGAIGGVTGEFAERAFVNSGVGVESAFEHDLRRGGHADAVLGRLHDLERRAEQAAGDAALIRAVGEPGRGGHHEERMRADHHRHRQRPLLLPGDLQRAPQMAARMQARRQLALRVQHRAVVAEIARLLTHHDAVGDVRRLVGLEMLEQRQFAQVDALLHHV